MPVDGTAGPQHFLKFGDSPWVLVSLAAWQNARDSAERSAEVGKPRVDHGFGGNGIRGVIKFGQERPGPADDAEFDSPRYRWRRGRLVAIPAKWLGQVPHSQTVRKRPAKAPHKDRKAIKHGRQRAAKPAERRASADD